MPLIVGFTGWDANALTCHAISATAVSVDTCNQGFIMSNGVCISCTAVQNGSTGWDANALTCSYASANKKITVNSC